MGLEGWEPIAESGKAVVYSGGDDAGCIDEYIRLQLIGVLDVRCCCKYWEAGYSVVRQLREKVLSG